MTKDQIIHTILDRVRPPGNVENTRVHPIDVENVASLFRSEFLKKIPENALDYYAKQYTASTSTDGTTSRKYVSLPIKIEDLPRIGSGVVNISAPTGSGVHYFPTTEREMIIYDNLETTDVLEANTIIDTIGYIVRYDRVDFDRYMTAASVRLMLIPTFDEYSSTEEVPLGPFEGQFIMGVTNYFLGQVKEIKPIRE